MYTNLQIDFIKEYGNKELKEGCVIDVKFAGGNFPVKFLYFNRERNPYYYHDFLKMSCPTTKENILEILGSEPHLFPDVAKKLKEKIDKDLNKMCEFKVTMDSIEIYGYRSVTGELKEFGPANNVFTKIQEIPFDPCLPLLSQPDVMEALLSLIK